MELDAVAGGVGDEGLAAGADGAGVADVEAPGPQLRDGVVEADDQEGEVLAETRRGSALDQVDLLPAGVEPRSAEPEVGPVGAGLEAEHIGVEAERGVDIGDVDGHVVHSKGSHDPSLPDGSPGVPGSKDDGIGAAPDRPLEGVGYMRIAVVGGTGLIGRHLVDCLEEQGVDVLALTRHSGVDVTTGAGLDDALVGAQRVVDVTNIATRDEAEATAFFTAAGRNLQLAAGQAGAERLLVLSIIGVDRFQGGYRAAKYRQEQAACDGPLPVTIVRAAQFHEYAGQVLEWGRDESGPSPVSRIPDQLVQPVAVESAAAVLADLARGEPPPAPMVEVAGPQPERLVDLAARLAAHRGDPVRIETVIDDSPDGKAQATGALVPGAGAVLTGPVFEDWLAAGERVP